MNAQQRTCVMAGIMAFSSVQPSSEVGESMRVGLYFMRLAVENEAFYCCWKPQTSLIHPEPQSNKPAGEVVHPDDGNFMEGCKLWHWRGFKCQHKQDAQCGDFLFHSLLMTPQNYEN